VNLKLNNMFVLVNTVQSSRDLVMFNFITLR